MQCEPHQQHHLTFFSSVVNIFTYLNDTNPILFTTNFAEKAAGIIIIISTV